MFETNNPSLKALFSVYKPSEILRVPSKEFRKYTLREETSLSSYEKWMYHKYAHSFQVLKEGIIIIHKEESLRKAPKQVKKQWMDALLLHDYGRAFEVMPLEKMKDASSPHGITSAKKVLQLNKKSLNILIPILLHDQIDNHFIDLSDVELEKIKSIAELPQNKKEIIYKIRKLYQKTSEREKKWIQLGIALLRDADTLSNLKDYKRLFCLLNNDPRAIISPLVYKSVYSGDFVKTEHVKTWPDKWCMYLAWVTHFRFPSSRKEVLQKNILEDFQKDLLNKIKCFNSLEQLKKLQKEMSFILTHIKNNTFRDFIIPTIPEHHIKKEEIRILIQSYLFKNKV